MLQLLTDEPEPVNETNGFSGVHSIIYVNEIIIIHK
jgi:hypothetical protein